MVPSERAVTDKTAIMHTKLSGILIVYLRVNLLMLNTERVGAFKVTLLLPLKCIAITITSKTKRANWIENSSQAKVGHGSIMLYSMT